MAAHILATGVLWLQAWAVEQASSLDPRMGWDGPKNIVKQNGPG